MSGLAIAKILNGDDSLILFGEEKDVDNYLDDLYEENCVLGNVEFDKNEFSHKCEYCEYLLSSGVTEECPVIVGSHEVNLGREECNILLSDYKDDMPWAEVINLL